MSGVQRDIDRAGPMCSTVANNAQHRVNVIIVITTCECEWASLDATSERFHNIPAYHQYSTRQASIVTSKLLIPYRCRRIAP